MNYRLSLFFGATLVLLIILSALTPRSAVAQAGPISELITSADHPDYAGTCPAEIRLKGQLRSNVETLGVVRYQFVHSDGTQGPISQITINHKGVYTLEETLRQNQSWTDTVFLRVFLPVPLQAPVPLDSDRITIKGVCREVQAVPRQATISLGPASGHFRVTLNGFTCNHQTAELNNPVLRDGADDEVFLFTKGFLVERASSRSEGVSLPFRKRTPVIGDTSTFTDRTQGGSGRFLGGNGGFRAGDSFPSSPDKLSTNPQAYSLPQLIWEGELTRRQNAMVIIPMIWEWDGLYGLFQAWETATLSQFSGVGELIADPNLTDQESAKVALRGEVVGQVWMNGRGGGVEPQDRPIGMRSYGDDYRFRPEVLILTYDEALRMANKSRTSGKAHPIVCADAPELGGNYTLYLQVEQL